MRFSGMPEPPVRKILFVCSRNQWRSPTAEQIWRRHPGLALRSAGVRSSARRTVTADDLEWADVVIVMEAEHKKQLKRAFGALARARPMHVLDIPDDYAYMDPELVAMLQESVASLLGLEEPGAQGGAV